MSDEAKPGDQESVEEYLRRSLDILRIDHRALVAKYADVNAQRAGLSERNGHLRDEIAKLRKPDRPNLTDDDYANQERANIITRLAAIEAKLDNPLMAVQMMGVPSWTVGPSITAAQVRERTTRSINDIGLGISGLPGEKLVDFRVYEENGMVQIWASVLGGDVLQYLTAEQAMEFARAFERCADEAIKNAPL